MKELSYGCEKKVKPWARGTKRPRRHTERAARSPGPLFDANGDGRTARPAGKIAHRHAVSFRRQTREKRQHRILFRHALRPAVIDAYRHHTARPQQFQRRAHGRHAHARRGEHSVVAAGQIAQVEYRRVHTARSRIGSQVRVAVQHLSLIHISLSAAISVR